MVAYTGDTSMAETLTQAGVKDARVLITECTFFEPDHRKRANKGQHMHVRDLLEALPQLTNELILLTHVSRRTHLKAAKKIFEAGLAKIPHPPKIEFLMDFAQRLWVKPGRAAPFTVEERELPDEAD
jgi:ribonuclease Z